MLCRAGAISGSGPSAFSRGGPGRGSKRKRGEKDPDTLMPVPFVKHHHSVKKFQVNTTVGVLIVKVIINDPQDQSKVSQYSEVVK